METKPNAHVALSYLRVSSVGQLEGDGFTRQRKTIAAYAEKHGIEVLEEFTDCVSGTLGMADRPGLQALFDRIVSNGVGKVLIERADRLSRDLISGELILQELKDNGIAVILTENGQELAGDSSPTGVLVRQILGAVSQFEKSAIVSKLRAARGRKRAATGKCEGRKPYGEKDGEPEVLALMRKLGSKGDRSYAWIARELTRRGHVSRTGKLWSPHSVRTILLRTGTRK